MNKLFVLLTGILLFSCNPGGNKAIIPVEEETHHEAESTKQEEKTDSLEVKK